MKIKAGELTRAALDWAVGQCPGEWPVLIYMNHVFLKEGEREIVDGNATALLWQRSERWSPSTDWAQGGPIIEREKIAIDVEHGDPWRARFGVARATFDGRALHYHHMEGPTPLIAAMRCYVASKLGEEIYIPEELL